MVPKAKHGKITQVLDGEVHRYSLRKGGSAVLYTVCCDCGLTHLEEFTPRKGYIKVRVWRDEARTKAQRRGKRKAK
jgi:hypothetical protein